jgi:RNA polymerase sigma factor (TIGR02999 family)
MDIQMNSPSIGSERHAANHRFAQSSIAFGQPYDDNFCMSEVTHILSRIASGDPSAADQLLPLVYAELRQLAAARLLRERPGQTLQATALVHDAYLRLVDSSRSENWNSRGHFFAAAAEAMRRILIENARRKMGPQRGGHLRRVNLDAAASLAGTPDEIDAEDLEALDAALTKLVAVAPRKAELVKLRYFAGLTNSEAAAMLNVSDATAERDWQYARVWLFHELSGDTASPSE